MNYKQLNGKTIREGFNELNETNPHIYKAFEEQALTAIEKGKGKLSAKLIINWIRWNEFVSSVGDKSFKINDAYQSYYARYFVEQHPEHSEVFNMRKLRNEESGPYMDVKKDKSVSFT